MPASYDFWGRPIASERGPDSSPNWRQRLVTSIVSRTPRINEIIWPAYAIERHDPEHWQMRHTQDSDEALARLHVSTPWCLMQLLDQYGWDPLRRCFRWGLPVWPLM